MPIPKPKYKVFPGVGIARLGPSDEFFLGPELPDPGFLPTEPPGHPWSPGGEVYRDRSGDRSGNIRRQAARFRVYQVTERDWNFRGGLVPVKAREITANDNVTLRWTVKIANAKAFLTDTPPPFDTTDAQGNRTPHPDRIVNNATAQISGRNQPRRPLIGDAKFPPGGATSVGLLLAEILTDDEGRLIILAGKGMSKDAAGNGLKLINGSSNNLLSPGWFDDVCDGSVECEVDGEAADRAWIVTGVPAFAQQIGHLVTLYDVAETVAVGKGKWPPELGEQLSVARHIYPLLRTTDLQRWVTDKVRDQHNDLFVSDDRLRKPDTPGALSENAHRAFRNRIGEELRSPITLQASGKKNVFLPHWYPRGADGKVINKYYGSDGALEAATHAPQPGLMPLQIGCPFTLTQWKRLVRWRIADKQDPLWDYVDAASIPRPNVLADLSGIEQIDTLNRAHMGSMVGGSATPGIEVGWKALESSSWGEAFRPAPGLLPGELTFSLSIPWPVDYLACGSQDVEHGGETVENDWWPAARPLVSDRGGADLDWDRGIASPLRNEADVNWWKSRGFFKDDGTDKYPEVEGPP